MKNARIATKIGTKTKFGMANSKIMVPNPKKQRIDHAHAPPLQNEKCSDRNENWYQGQFRHGELKNRGLKSRRRPFRYVNT